jgi:hypothetical protein
MNQYNIEPVRLIVDNTQPTRPLHVTNVVSMISTTNTTTNVYTAVQYVFDLSNQPEAAVFTPFDQLTEDQVISWVTADTMSDQTAAAYLKLEQLLSPSTSSSVILMPSLPWNPPPPTYDPNSNGAPAVSTSSSSTATVTATVFIPTLEAITALIQSVLAEHQENQV